MSLFDKIADVYHPLNYTIHTIELQKKISFEEYKRLKNMFIAEAVKNKYKFYPNDNKISFTKFNQRGLCISAESRLPSGHYLTLKLNLKDLVLGHRSYYALFQYGKDSLSDMDYNFRKMLSVLGVEHTAETFLLSRVDFCVNAFCNSPDEVKTYIALARKGNYPKGYKETFPFAERRKNKKQIDHRRSFDLTNENREVQISLYDKYEQLLNINIAKETAKHAKGILRFEKRCYKKEIYSILGEYEPVYYDLSTLKYLLSMARYELIQEIETIFTAGRYYLLETAQKKIDESKLKQHEKEQMQFWIYAASKHQRSSVAWNMTVEKFNLDGYHRKKLKQNMAQLDLNPTTIGVRSRFETLPSIRSVFYTSNP